MKIGTSVANQRQICCTSLASFLLITFGLAWGILGAAINVINWESKDNAEI